MNGHTHTQVAVRLAAAAAAAAAAAGREARREEQASQRRGLQEGRREGRHKITAYQKYEVLEGAEAATGRGVTSAKCDGSEVAFSVIPLWPRANFVPVADLL